MLGLLLLIAAMLALTALYVGAEFASVAVKKIKIEALADQGDARAARLLPHISDAGALDRYVAACQIGITLASLILGAVGQGRLAAFLGPYLREWAGLEATAAASVAASVVLLTLTGLQVVLGELVPKAVALRFPEGMALALTTPMLLSLRLFSWFIVILNGSGNLILKILGVPSHGHRHVHSPEELEQLLAHGVTAGALEADEHRRLKQALRFGRRPVSELMVPRTRMVALDVDEGIEAALALVEESPFTRFPLYRESEDHILGIVHLKDLSLALAREGPPASLEGLMRPALLVPATMHVDGVLERMRRQRSQMAILVDEYGGTEGLVTMEDLLEEVLGEIDDEFDRARPPLIRVAPGEYLVRGVLPLIELEERIGLKPETRDVQTVGGLVMHLVGDIPVIGSTVMSSGFQLVVEEMRGRQITRVRIRVLRERKS